MNFREFVSKNGRPIKQATNSHVFHLGDEEQSLYVVQQGLLKAYYLSEDGRENIKSFISEGDVIGSLSACFGKKPTTFSLMALEPCELIALDFSILYEAASSDRELSLAMVDFLLSFGMKKEMREYEFLCLSAEERYRKLMADTPQLFERVSQNDIARYLGITPVGLSRIKKRVS